MQPPYLKKILSYQEYLDYVRDNGEILKIWQTREKIAFVTGLILGGFAVLVLTSFLQIL